MDEAGCSSGTGTQLSEAAAAPPRAAIAAMEKPQDERENSTTVTQGRHDDSQTTTQEASSSDFEAFKLNARPTLGGRHGSSVSVAQIKGMYTEDKVETDTYGVSETRDGFFDALFLKSMHSSTSDTEWDQQAQDTLPRQFDKGSPLSPRHFVPRQWHEIQSLIRKVTRTRSGIRLAKAFIAFFIAYVLCLVPTVRDWLGRYSYIMVVSVILNHPSRPLGSQLDGTILTIGGTAAGLGWGVIGLLLSNSTLAAKAGYGGILALFLALFMTCIAWMRSFVVRAYQGVLCAGIAITFTALAQTSGHGIHWKKLYSYAIPWLFGQAISLIVNCLILPDAGSRALARTLNHAFNVMQEALVVPRPRNTRLRRRMQLAIVDLSQACRDMRIDLTIIRFSPDDAKSLRNLMQAILRALLSMETQTSLLQDWNQDVATQHDGQVAITIDPPSRSRDGSHSSKGTDLDHSEATEHGSDHGERLLITSLSQPTKDLLTCMREALQRCNAGLMDLSGHRRSFGPAQEISSDVSPLQGQIKAAMQALDFAESTLLETDVVPAATVHGSDVVELFVFVRHVRETAAAIEKLLTLIADLQLNATSLQINSPSYPWRKAIHRTNAQVRHDRGGITAGHYQNTFAEIAQLLDKIKSREHKPGRHHHKDEEPEQEHGVQGLGDGAGDSYATMDAGEINHHSGSKKAELSYKIWLALHRLQGFESRFAFKVCLVTSLLSVPSYLSEGMGWWDEYEAWWAVAMSWIMMHPRVGGNLQDFFTRAFSAVLGALWAGAGHAADRGNPYVVAVFAVIYMVPMLYRFTQSSHPRSGLVGCFSFVVVSLTLQTYTGEASTMTYAMRKGLVFLVGTTAPILVNWVLWPFVARNEMRHALSSMMFFMSIIYRSVVAKYVYFQEGRAPTVEDIKRSEILEGRLREGFVRVRQLLVMTRHEICLKGDFDPLPYSALADACERFFEDLIAVRQSALFYNPHYIRDNPVAAKKLLGHRRDAVAAILGNLYILAGALKSKRKVPKYLPSAFAARKKLLRKTQEVEKEMATTAAQEDVRWEKKWSNIYSYSYNESLTGCVARLEELERFTKLIVGEQSFADKFKDDTDNDHEIHEDEQAETT